VAAFAKSRASAVSRLSNPIQPTWSVGTIDHVRTDTWPEEGEEFFGTLRQTASSLLICWSPCHYGVDERAHSSLAISETPHAERQIAIASSDSTSASACRADRRR
jgi:hypothetical protein